MPGNFTFEDHSDDVKRALEAQVERALEAAGLLAEGYAKANLTQFPRVDTGRLRNSVTHVVQKEWAGRRVACVGTNVEYTPYVEYGTGPMAEGTTADGKQIHGRQDVPWFYKDANGKGHLSYGMAASHFLKKSASDQGDQYRQIAMKYLKG